MNKVPSSPNDLPPKTRVRILSFVGSKFENDWSQTGIILKPRKSSLPLPGLDWYVVRWDDSGGALCVHRSRLMVCNDQAAP